MELETADKSANKSFIKAQQIQEHINDIVSLQNKKSKEFQKRQEKINEMESFQKNKLKELNVALKTTVHDKTFTNSQQIQNKIESLETKKSKEVQKRQEEMHEIGSSSPDESMEDFNFESFMQANSTTYPPLMNLTPKRGKQKNFGFHPRHRNGKIIGYICEWEDPKTG